MRPIWAIAALLASTASGSAAAVAPPASRRRFDDPDRWDGRSIGGGWPRYGGRPPSLTPIDDEQRRRLAQARDKRARKAERRRYFEARSAGHDVHCAARIAYGDGEPECMAAWPCPWTEPKPAKATRVDVRDESYTSDPDEGGGW